MGVAGCGKSSVGAGLVEEGVCTYIDGDDLHSAASIQKMAQGIALTDKDREPWLKRVGETLTKTDGVVVIACSALKRKYREYIIQGASETVGFLHLCAPKDVIAKRMSVRRDHFMPTTLLDSQFRDLEPLQAGEIGWDIDIYAPLDAVIRDAKAKIQLAA